MDKNEDSGSPGWGASFFMQTTEDVARAFLAAASAATVRSTRPSVVFSSRDDNSNSQLQKLQSQVTKVLKGFSPPPEVKGAYNPEVLTSQKRQWSRFQLQSLDQRPVKEPSKVFESMIVVGLHPNVDVQALQKLVLEKNNEDSKKKRGLLNNNVQVQAEPNLEPQVLFVYPPEKQLPLKYKDLLSFCFPGGVEVHAVERTPSLSELNEILLGQEQLKQNNQSFVFRLQVADDSTLYGCCVLVDEMVQKPSNLVSMLIGEPSYSPSLSRHILTTSRCYCILSRLPFFELHFGILRSFQGSPSEDRNFRSDTDEVEVEEPSSSGLEDSSGHGDILEWAKANGHGSLQIICEYYQLHCPARGSKLTFQPLEHLHPLEFHRPGETVLHIADSTVDLRSCNTSLEVAEAHGALLAEEEAIALSVWTIACICGCLRLENIVTMFAGALLEKQIVIICSNLGILSAAVLSVVPLIRPYQWQSLLMPILPNDMLDFLDAPVPYIVGIKNKTADIQPKLANAILIDANKNQVRSPSMPQLPRQRELLSSLGPYHAKLVGESFLARKRPVYECTDVQVEAAKGFLTVLRSYLDSLCSNLRSHTITNVQSNNDKVSLLLKESFIESFPHRDRAFMKLFVDTQLFSVHTDLVLSFYQKD